MLRTSQMALLIQFPSETIYLLPFYRSQIVYITPLRNYLRACNLKHRLKVNDKFCYLLEKLSSQREKKI